MRTLKAEAGVYNLLKYIGEDPDREGLERTPARVIASYAYLFAGYGKSPRDLLTTFTECSGYDEIVLLKDIEMYSMCEHHMLPFFGKAHIGYLPGNCIIGVSKLARLLEIYCRRLQIQERIGEQVTGFLMEELNLLMII